MSSDFKEEVLGVIDERDDFQIRVIKYNERPPILEKRAIYKVNDEVRIGKRIGITKEDLEEIMKRINKIHDLLGK